MLWFLSLSLTHAHTHLISFFFCFFAKVWEESSGECLLQIQLLVALRNFVVALGYQSPICYDILLPILQKGIDIDSPDELNLLEDSMLVCLFKFVFNILPADIIIVIFMLNAVSLMCSYGKPHFPMLLQWCLNY